MDEFLLFLLGAALVLSLVLSPILAIIALRRTRRATDRMEVLETSIESLERRLRDAARPPAAAVTTPATQSASMPAPDVSRPAEVRAAPPEVATPYPSSPPVTPQPPSRLRAPLPSRAITIPPDDEPVASEPAKPPINWELFTGARLFAWVGGLALFLGVAFLMKYSIDHGLISPAVRLAMGFVLGAVLIVGGLATQKKGFAITAYTLCATGPAVLYATTFAAHNLYHFIGTTPTFALLALWTTLAFVLAVVLDARYIAVLALIGGFLTPPLVSTGVDNPFGLFGYIALLDVGLAAVALRKRWDFLLPMAAIGTAAMQLGWADKFFEMAKVNTAITVFLVFPILFLAILIAAKRRDHAGQAHAVAAGGLHLVSIAFAAFLQSYAELAARPGLSLGFLLALNLSLSLYQLFADDLARFHAAAGTMTFLILAVWTDHSLTLDLLPWALGFYLAFAIVQGAVPIIVQRIRPQAKARLFATLFPIAMLALVLLPIAKDLTAPLLIWPIVLLLDAVAVVAALASGLSGAVILVLLLTFATSGLWMMRLPDATDLPGLLVILALFVIAFFAAGVWYQRRPGAGKSTIALGPGTEVPLLPTLAALLPFVLLCMVTAKLPMDGPGSVFGLALLLVGLLLGLARHLMVPVLALVTLGSVTALEVVWQSSRFDPARPAATLAWYAIFLTVFLIYPFAFRTAFAERKAPWLAAAFAGPIQFYLVWAALSAAQPDRKLGALALAFAIVYLVALVLVQRATPGSPEIHRSRLAYMGGVMLLFVSLVFPLQFDREWLTIGWALEGMALCWLYRRIAHDGLKIWGAALLVIAFARLSLNPAVLTYHPRSPQPIWNWYLYAYLTVALAALIAARLWRPKDETLGPVKVPQILDAIGGILLFLLVNIEIADYYSTGTTLTFQFTGNFARDLAYSLAWGLFGLALLVIAIRSGGRGARIASLMLIVVTVLKLFLHDLWRLGGLYRVGAFIGLAAVLMLVSFLYQRFLTDRGEVAATDTESS